MFSERVLLGYHAIVYECKMNNVLSGDFWHSTDTSLLFYLCLVAIITTDPLNTKYYTSKILYYMRLKNKGKWVQSLDVSSPLRLYLQINIGNK
jgi:hypothetical protein